MRKILLFILSVAAISQAKGQNSTYSVSGTIISQLDDDSLPGANVILTHVAEGTRIGAASDVQGNFVIEQVKPGDYMLSVNYVGYKSYEQPLRVQNEDIELGKLFIVEETLVIDEVQVTARAPLGEQRGDTTQFNAKAFKTAPDASVEDLVSKMPGIVIQDGVVQAQGEEVRQVMIDGKRFSGDVGSALRSLPSDMIESVEVFDRQSDRAAFSGFDDGNREKTLNLVTRKDRRKGESGKISAGYGTDERYMVGAAINLFNNDRKITAMALTNNINMSDFSIGETPGGSSRRRRGGGWGGGAPSGITSTNAFGVNYNDMWGQKMEISSSYNFSAREALNSDASLRDYTGGQQEGNRLEQSSLHNSEEKSHRFNFRMQYNINENNRLIISPNISFQDNNSVASGLSLLNDADGNAISNSETNNLSDNTSLNFSNNILYSRRFSRPGRVFTANINTSYSNTDQESWFDELSLNNINPELNTRRDQFNLVKRNNIAWSGSASMSEKVGNNALMQLEYTIGNQKNDADRRTFDLVPELQTYTELNMPLSNTFESDYLSQSIGPSYQYRNEKTRLQLDAKYQFASLNSNTIYPEMQDLSRDFSNFLPSAELEYKFTNSRSLNLNFRTSTNVPSSEQLQEVLNISNPLQVSIGNSDLQQDYQNRLFLRYRNFNSETNQVFFLGVFATATQNFIGNSVYENPGEEIVEGLILQPGARLIRRENMDGHWDARAFFNYGKPLNFISSNFNLRGSVGYNRIPGKINNESNFANNTNFGLGLNLSSNISEKVDFNISTNSSYNVVGNTNAVSVRNNNNYFSQNSSLQLSWIFWKGFVYRTELNSQFNTGVTAGQNNNFTVWNMSVGKKFLKDNKAEVSLSLNDVLDQNTSFRQNVTESYVEDVRSTVLQRFFMLTFTYNLRSYAGEEAPGSNSGGRPSGGRGPRQ